MSDKKNKPPVEDIDCMEAINGLYQYLDGEMEDAESKQRFEYHLTHCKTCYTRTEMENVARI